MGTSQIIEQIESKFLKKKKPKFNVGDTVRVHTKIVEEKKERIQIFTGAVIAIKGTGLSETFTVYRNAYGCSMERVFLINSPRISDIEVIRPGKVKRAKLYYLQGKTGKKSKIKELMGVKPNRKGATLAEEQEEAVQKDLEKLEEQKPSEVVEEKPVEKKAKEEKKPEQEAKAKPKKEKEEKKKEDTEEK